MSGNGLSCKFEVAFFGMGDASMHDDLRALERGI